MMRIELCVLVTLDMSNIENNIGPFVQELEDFVINLVYPLPEFFQFLHMVHKDILQYVSRLRPSFERKLIIQGFYLFFQQFDFIQLTRLKVRLDSLPV